MEENETYFPVSRGIIDHFPEITGNQLKVYFYLLSRARFTGKEKGTVKTRTSIIAEGCGIDKSDVRKILKTLQNRCMHFEFKKIPPCEMRRLLHDVCQKERVEYIPKVLDQIVKESDGLARNALYLLQQKVMLLT